MIECIVLLGGSEIQTAPLLPSTRSPHHRDFVEDTDRLRNF